MNRNQRRYGRLAKRNESDGRIKGQRNSLHSEIQEAPKPQFRRDLRNKPMTNRSCFFCPDQKSVGQLTDRRGSQLIHQQLLPRRFDPSNPDGMDAADKYDSKKSFPASGIKVENGSQYDKPDVDTLEDQDWQTIDNTDEIDKFIMQAKDEETLTQYHSPSKEIHISEVPRVKIIAEKFSKYKKYNVELRKLEEKVVCVEYDVFDQSDSKQAKPTQTMRAFFSIKPVANEPDNVLKELPSSIKNKFEISTGDLQMLNRKEVEIIDGKILENQPYLDDLRKLLRRKQDSPKRKKQALDLQSLYEIAKSQYLDINSDRSYMLSKEELLEVQEMILKKCQSSAHGINRRSVKPVDSAMSNKDSDITAISQSIVLELLREERKINGFN